MKVLTSDIEFFSELNDLKPVKRPNQKVSDYIEGLRLMPTASPFPGPWLNHRTPYLVEIMDNMSPSSPIQRQAIMKSAQIGLTAAIENIIAYGMGCNPCSILYISATQELLNKWTKRLEPLIDSCGLRHLMEDQSEAGNGNRRTGDKLLSKQFSGGFLEMGSAQSAPSLRADSIQDLFIDEIDGCPILLSTGEGSFIEVCLARTVAFGHRRKISLLSTPTTYEKSAIYQEYMDGDQRKYYVPCPHCGEYQVLNWGSEKTKHGIKAELEDGVLTKVYYVCEFCHGKIRNYQKTKMLAAGEWRPTAKSNSKLSRSYHISALYAPVGFQTWFNLYESFLKSQSDENGARSFTNLILGEPYRETGSRPPLESIIGLKGEYRRGTVPDNVIFLTAAIDVQAGNKDDPDHPPRLEMEVCGHGLGYRTWSVEYKVFKGSIDNENDGAWLELTNWATENGFGFRDKNNVFFPVRLTLIDSGFKTDVVYNFTSRWESTYPSKGFKTLAQRKVDKGDEWTHHNFKKYRRAKMVGEIILYEISTNHYKNIIYSNLDIPRAAFPPQPTRLCSFPIDYGSNYFKQLRAEEKRVDGSYHDFGRRNEALDVRVMNLAAAEVFIDSWVQDLRAYVKAEGGTLEDINKIRSDTVLEERPWEKTGVT